MKKNIRNSLYAYIIGDALGVPFEFKRQGEFKCTELSGYGTYYKPVGTWSDDTSILLCILDALTKENTLAAQVEQYKKNLLSWWKESAFTVDGLFDIGGQTRESIQLNFQTRESDRMGNGALFCSFPLAFYLLNEDNQSVREQYIHAFCEVTHNNTNCFEYSFKFAEIIRSLLLADSSFNNPDIPYENKGDVINTFHLIIAQYKKLISIDKPLLSKLCDVVNLGEDTDTNAAFVGGLLGLMQSVEAKHIKKLRGNEIVKEVVDRFLLCNH